MPDTLENIARYSTFQENQHYIDDIPIFKAKGPQSFDDLLEQIDKVAALTNKDPYKLALEKSQISCRRTISSFLPSRGGNKIKEWLHYNFVSIATKQHAVSMLVDQQQKPSKTLQACVQQYSDLLPQVQQLITTPT